VTVAALLLALGNREARESRNGLEARQQTLPCLINSIVSRGIYPLLLQANKNPIIKEIKISIEVILKISNRS
jgi:hypothetical protein